MIHVAVMMESESFGGPARNLLETARRLKDRVRFSIITFQRGSARSSEFMQQIEAMGFELHVLKEGFRYDPRAIMQMGRLITRLKPDILQIHNTKSRFYASLLRVYPQIRALPQIHLFHGETWVDTKQIIYNRLDRMLFRKSKNVITVSKKQKSLLESWGVDPEKITVLSNAVVPPKNMAKTAGSEVNILCIGRLSKEKGQIILVRAVRELVTRGKTGFRVLLVGDGKEYEEIKKYIEVHGLGKWVSLEGHQPNPVPYYQKASLFVLSSLTEGFPNVLLEAAVFEIPIIAFDVGGIPEIFEHGKEAWLIGQHDSTALAEAIGRFLEDPEPFRAMARMAKTRVERDFNMEKKAENLFEYYQRLLQKHADGT